MFGIYFDLSHVDLLSCLFIEVRKKINFVISYELRENIYLFIWAPKYNRPFM